MSTKTSENGNRPNLKINLDYHIPTSKDGTPQLSNRELTADYIEAAVSSTHPQGLEGQMRRTYGWVQRKLDDAINAGKDEIELEKAEQDLLRKSFSECKIPSRFAKYFVILEEEIERATKS